MATLAGTRVRGPMVRFDRRDTPTDGVWSDVLIDLRPWRLVETFHLMTKFHRTDGEHIHSARTHAGDVRCHHAIQS